MMTANLSDLVGAALELLPRGWWVFPCQPRGKAPATADGFKSATTDPDQIRGWFDRSDYNVAIATGPSGLVVVDIDDRDSWERLTDGLEVTPTLWASTPSGGWHLYYALPNGADVKCSAGKLAPGIDIRSRGGYVVAPPSSTDTGSWRWRNDLDPAPLSGWIVDALTPKPRPRRPIGPVRLGGGDRYARAAMRDEAEQVSRAPEGCRNHRLNEAAFSLGQLVGSGDLQPGDVENSLTDAAHAAGLDEHEIRATLRSGLAAGMAQPRQRAQLP